MEDYEIINVYLAGLDDKANAFIKEQVKKVLAGGSMLSFEDLQVDVPTAFLVMAARRGGVMKNIAVKNTQGKAIKKFTEKDLLEYKEESAEDIKKLYNELSKGVVYVTLTPMGWQETLKELLDSEED